MPRWWNNLITIYHQNVQVDEETKRTVRTWERVCLSECFFGVRDEQSLNGNTLSVANSYTVRIPYSGQLCQIVPGDIIVRGHVPDEIADEQGKRTTDLLQKYKPFVFTVRAVSDNTKIVGLAHYKLTGA